MLLQLPISARTIWPLERGLGRRVRKFIPFSAVFHITILSVRPHRLEAPVCLDADCICNAVVDFLVVTQIFRADFEADFGSWFGLGRLRSGSLLVYLCYRRLTFEGECYPN